MNRRFNSEILARFLSQPNSDNQRIIDFTEGASRMSTPPVVPVAEPTFPIIADASPSAYVTKGLTLGFRQVLLASVGAAAAHGLLPAGLLDGGKAETYAAIGAFIVLAGWGQYREAHQHSKIVVLASKVDDIFARVINARRSK